jgi:hypothetical protein
MVKLHAETLRDQEMVDKLQRALEQLRKYRDERVGELEDENRKLREQLDE